MLEKKQLSEIMSCFGLTFSEMTEFHDTSHGSEDIRWNFILDQKYVLKINSARSMREARLQEISRLIGRYNSIGVYAPRLIPGPNGKLSCEYEIEGKKHICFVEEYAAYPICGDDCDLDWNTVTEHLGILAAKYSDTDLSEIRSMWTIIDLAPLDTDVDEKQENADLLVKTLEEAGLRELAREVTAYHEYLRAVLIRDYQKLPRCVYQGDLNMTNVLHDNGRFAGLIDFNMSGTDVNINVFVNETNEFPETEQFDRMSVHDLLEWMNEGHEKKMESILRHYSLSGLEKRLIPYYNQIANLFQWPNVCQMRRWLRDGIRRDKCAEFICGLMNQPME